MDEFHDGLQRFCDETLYKVDIIAAGFVGDSEHIRIITAIDKVFEFYFVAVLFFEQLEHGGACRHGVVEPIEQFLRVARLVHQKEVIEKCCESDDVDLRIIYEPLFEVFRHALQRVRIDWVYVSVFDASPAVTGVIIYLCGIPQAYRKKVDGVFVHRHGAIDKNLAIADIFPIENFFSDRSVIDLPIFFVFKSVYLYLLGIIAFDQIYRQSVFKRRLSLGNECDILYLVFVRIGVIVVASYQKIGLVDFFGKFGCVYRKFRSVAIAHRVRAPFFNVFSCSLDKVVGCWNSHPAFFHFRHLNLK